MYSIFGNYKLVFSQKETSLWIDDETSPCINIIDIYKDTEKVFSIKLSLSTTDELYLYLMNMSVFGFPFRVVLPSFSTTERIYIDGKINQDDKIELRLFSVDFYNNIIKDIYLIDETYKFEEDLIVKYFYDFIAPNE